MSPERPDRFAILHPMTSPAWTLRLARPEDRGFLLALKEAAMRPYVEQVWGWDDAEQAAYFDERFVPEHWQIIQVEGQDAGVLIVEEDAEQVYLAEIEVLPAWQGQGIGTAAIGSLIARATATGKPLNLRVLHVNTRARALYERLGFRPYKEIDTHIYLRWEGA
jgi:GNAT superfamily N-acetyltransferase